MRLIPFLFTILISFGFIEMSMAQNSDTTMEECTPKDQFMPVGGHCCDGLIPQKEGFQVRCVEEEPWFNWNDFFLGLAVPFLVFAYIAIFVKRKQKKNS